MAFDLYAWPIDGPVSQQEAAAELERLLDEDIRDDAADPRLRAFVADLRALFPAGFPDDDEIGEDWHPPDGAVVFELDVSREHVFLGIPWPFVSQVGEAAQEVASRHDVLLFDPQKAAAILPPNSVASRSNWVSTRMKSRRSRQVSRTTLMWISRTSTWPTAAMRCEPSCARHRPPARGSRTHWGSR